MNRDRKKAHKQLESQAQIKSKLKRRDSSDERQDLKLLNSNDFTVNPMVSKNTDFTY